MSQKKISDSMSDCAGDHLATLRAEPLSTVSAVIETDYWFVSALTGRTPNGSERLPNRTRVSEPTLVSW
jgi:hypothetical protein